MKELEQEREFHEHTSEEERYREGTIQQDQMMKEKVKKKKHVH